MRWVENCRYCGRLLGDRAPAPLLLCTKCNILLCARAPTNFKCQKNRSLKIISIMANRRRPLIAPTSGLMQPGSKNEQKPTPQASSNGTIMRLMCFMVEGIRFGRHQTTSFSTISPWNPKMISNRWRELGGWMSLISMVGGMVPDLFIAGQKGRYFWGLAMAAAN